MEFHKLFDIVRQRQYIGSMKIKTSITLSEEIIRSIDELFGEQKNRSEIIEQAIKDYIERYLP